MPIITFGSASLSQAGANLYLDTAVLHCDHELTATPSIFKCTSSKVWETAYCGKCLVTQKIYDISDKLRYSMKSG